MKKRLLPVTTVALAAMLLSSCGGSTAWSWEKASSDGVLKYGLLIGQIDHNDSAARTAGIRDALKTRTSTHATNPNTEKAVEGKLTLGGKEYKVVEEVNQECKSTGGATWDQATATTTVENWLSNHSDLDFIVSNNDGMAEGAIAATNWVEGTPIFGYDSNQSTLKYIKEGKVMGTINQNAPAQAAAIYMAARNAVDGFDGADVYKYGFTEANKNGYGQIASAVSYGIEAHSLLVDNVAVTSANVDSFMTDDITTLVEKGVTKGSSKAVNVFQTYYSSSDTFLNSSMSPLFKKYADLFNFKVNEFRGDGSDDTTCLNALDSALAGGTYDAYIINMVKTTSTKNYLDKIADGVKATEANPTSVPVIFWNRQGTLDDGSVDKANMNDKRFKNIFYVGFDANQGGQLQGQMIVDYLNNLAK